MTDILTNLSERAAVTDAVTSLFVETDNRNWPAVLQCFAPRVHFDMTSLAGGQPSEVAREDIAHARSGRNTRTFVGTYDLELEKKNDRWQITLFRFNVKFVDGNLELEADAAAPEPARA